MSFKQSLFSGVLDKGKDEVFLGGTRLKQFMDSVDKATGQRHLKLPIPKKEILQGLANLLSEFSKKM